MKSDTRCVEGRLMRHIPQFYDPYYESDKGQCPECDGKGCPEPSFNLFNMMPRGPWKVSGGMVHVNGHHVWSGDVTGPKHDWMRLAYIQSCEHCGGFTAEQAQVMARVMAASWSMLAALYEAEEALDKYADADQPPGCNPIPNAAMSALMEVKEAIAEAEGRS